MQVWIQELDVCRCPCLTRQGLAGWLRREPFFYVTLSTERSMDMPRIALVGDRDSAVLAHQAIDRCFVLAQEVESLAVEGTWVPTQSIVPGSDSILKSFAGVWCVPASPYQNTEGAIWAIQFARKAGVPFLGTCGGFQHAVLEFARNALGLPEADHQELHPDALLLLVSRMECALVEKSQSVLVVPGHSFRAIYGADSGLETYHCNYGLNPAFERLFRDSPFQIAARDEAGAVRAMVLRDHCFFVGTLFQPERRALAGALHPVVRAFFGAVLRQSGNCQA
jgi:CTP synthase (UTP-ammonia lyase)